MTDHQHHSTDGPYVSPRRRAGAAFWLAVSALAVVVLVAANIAVMARRRASAAEIERLRSAMTAVERARADQIVGREQHTLRIALELLRRQAQLEQTLHLSVTVDSARMYLEREGALLRDMPVQIGPERRVGIPPDTVRLAAPRGVRTVVAVLSDADEWSVPDWVYMDRGIPLDSARRVRGALGPVAILLDGGTIVYSMPQVGPLNDSSYVLPGAVRARPADLAAILPNLQAGMRVYFY
jgi:hypothetical protein